MESLWDNYRPRKRTKREEQADKDQKKAKFSRVIQRIQRDTDEALSPVPGQLKYTSSFAYKDFIIGKAAPVLSRTELDNRTRDRRRIEAPWSSTPTPTDGQRVPSLSSICFHVVVQHYHLSDPESPSQDVLSSLDTRHLPLVWPLVKAVRERDGIFPFFLWMRLAHSLSLALPKNLRSFRGLVLDDVKELKVLAEVNRYSREEWEEQRTERERRAGMELEYQPPSFFLAVVDLRGLPAFSDAEMWRLASVVAPFLSALTLNGTKVTDSGISTIVRTLGEDKSQNFERLQILGLRSLKHVTDSCAKSLAKLPSLRMIDLRGSSCTDAFHRILIKSARERYPASKPWRPALPRPDVKFNPSIEFEIFGPSHSHSNILSRLYYLAKPADARVPFHEDSSLKPLIVNITSIARPSEEKTVELGREKTVEELLAAQDDLLLKKNKSAFSREHGTIFGSVKLDPSILRVDAAAEDKGAAFRAQDDEIASGAWIRQATTGASSLYAAGARKLSQANEEVDETLSDRGEEGDEEDQLDWERRYNKWEEKPEFYRPRDPPTKRDAGRKPLIAAKSNLMLVRHLPLTPPHERPPLPSYPAVPNKETSGERSKATDTEPLVVKKKRPFSRQAPPSRPQPSPTSSSTTTLSSSPLIPRLAPLTNFSREGTASSSLQSFSSSFVEPRSRLASSPAPSNSSFTSTSTRPTLPLPHHALAMKASGINRAVPTSAASGPVKTVQPVKKRSGLAIFRRKGPA
ncbi:hypothetical protein T439DRAFT_380197 [Meredithblackwellia eburnea MCA 4105]